MPLADDDIARLALLDDPVRRRLYEHVCGSDEPVGREAAAGAAGIGRSLAAYHLDRLAAQGLLEVGYARPQGRGGPGAGRPAKRYRRPAEEIAVSVPPRDYRLAADLLARAADAGTDAALAAAGEAGRKAGRTGGDVGALLRARGYEPAREADGTLRLRNCPFDAVARSHPELVCALNLAVLRGLLEGAGLTPADACLDPRPGRCCVALTGYAAEACGET